MKKLQAIILICMGVGLFSLSWSISQSATAEETARFTGNENHDITLIEAQDMIHHFQLENEDQEVQGGYFGKAAILRVLNQDGAVGIRYYFGYNEAGQPNLILVGVDKAGNDMVKGELAERALPCPPLCDGVRLDMYIPNEMKLSDR